MTKEQWLNYFRNAREEAMMLPHRATSILFDLILTLGNVVFERCIMIKAEDAPPSFAGPCSPRDARDEIEGEAVAPTDHEYDYCAAVWRGNIPWKAHARLGCTRPVHTTGDHVVSAKNQIIARWPMTDEEKSKLTCKVAGCDKLVAPGSATLCLEHIAESA